MKERPIIFNGEMVRAILEGRKTQTRRIIKPQPSDYGLDWIETPEGFAAWQDDGVTLDEHPPKHRLCPFGQVGDHLWVRETFTTDVAEGFSVDVNGYPTDSRKIIVYKATHYDPACYDGKWTPSIHMPRWASRITLEITGVRVERVNEITDADAMAEGIYPWYLAHQYDENATSYWSPQNGSGAAQKFSEMWNSIHPGSWNRNDWVWVIEFKLIKKGE